MSASSSPDELGLASSGSSESGETSSGKESPEQVCEYRTVDLAGLMRSMYDSFRTWHDIHVADAKPGEPKSIPPVYMLIFPSLFEKSWGYDRLYPKALSEWCSYHAYLQKFYILNCVPSDGLNAYELCKNKESELRDEWVKNQISVPKDEIELSSKIDNCLFKLMLSKAAPNITAINAAKCIAKETELIIERLRRAPNLLDPDQHLNQSTQIRQLAFSYMSKEEEGCESDSDIAHLVINVAMVGIMKEAELMCVHLGLGHPNSYEIYLNTEIRCFALDLATEKLSNLMDTAVMAQRWKTRDENKLKLASSIEDDAQMNPRHYDCDVDSEESDPSAKKAPANENLSKEAIAEKNGASFAL